MGTRQAKTVELTPQVKGLLDEATELLFKVSAAMSHQACLRYKIEFNMAT